MPIVIPAGASSSSAAQVVPTSAIFDYVQNDAGVAIAGVTVTAILNGTFTTTISPQVVLNPVQITTTTDANGFWSLNLVPNTNISPANTTYTITIVGFRSYDITVGPSGPYQSTSLGTLVSIPATLGPATSSITGALTVSGAFSATAGATISGGLTVTGTLSLPGASLSMTGPLTLTAAASQIIPGVTSLSLRNNANGADNLLVTDAGLVTARAGLVATAGGITATAGDLAVTAGKITMGAAASQLVPGATSFSVRDNANANDNLLVSNAGNATVRGSLTVTAGPLTVTAGGETITAGDLTVTAGRIVMAAAASKIVPGATSLAIRDNADANSNVLITNAGLVTLRNELQVPPSAGAALPTITAGASTLPVKLDDQSTASATSLTLTVPAGALYRYLEIDFTGRSDQAGAQNLQMQLNADVGANYDSQRIDDTNVTITAIAPSIAATQAIVGVISASGAVAGSVSDWTVLISNADSTTLRKPFRFYGGRFDADAAANATYSTGHGQWRNTANAATSVKLFPPAGNLINARAILYGRA